MAVMTGGRRKIKCEKKKKIKRRSMHDMYCSVDKKERNGKEKKKKKKKTMKVRMRCNGVS